MSYLPSNPNANLIDAFKATPEAAHHLHHFAQTVMRGPTQLTALQRELIAARVSHANGCVYCRDSHLATARNLGADEDTLRSVVEDSVPAVDGAMRAAFAYADKLNDRHREMEQGDVDAFLAAGWDEAALHNVILVVGFFNMMNRWIEGLGIGSDPKLVEMAGRMLAGSGYTSVNDLLGRG